MTTRSAGAAPGLLVLSVLPLLGLACGGHTHEEPWRAGGAGGAASAATAQAGNAGVSGWAGLGGGAYGGAPPVGPCDDEHAPLAIDAARPGRMPNPSSVGLPNSAWYSPAAEVVVDEVTHLTWQRAPREGSLSRLEAERYCDQLVLAERSDWRLPTRLELVSLVDFTVRPSIDAAAFPNTPADWFWSASYLALNDASAWAIDYSKGSAFVRAIESPAQVRCVSGDPRPRPNFDPGPGVVSDRVTGLLWQADVDPLEKLSFDEATRHCASLVLGGRCDWRAPSVNELQTLLNERRIEPALDTEAFPNTPVTLHWSSSPAAGTEDEAWLVSFETGEAKTDTRAWERPVRCVSPASHD